MKKIILSLLIIFLLCFGVVSAKTCGINEIDSIFNNYYDFKSSNERVGMANPASVYCHELGYETKIVETEKGQRGICIFPDGNECEQWQFLEGKCGIEYSYCARHGYDLRVKSDGNNPFSRHYAVCAQRSFPWFEVGSVTDLTDLSDKAQRGDIIPAISPLSSEPGVQPLAGSLPTTFDWRNNNGDWMTSVKDQGDCGSCWAFTACGVTEARHNIQKNNRNIDWDLSEQELVSDCYYWDNCCGGSKSSALWYIVDEGIVDETCFPYLDGSDCTCFPNPTCNTDCLYDTGGATGGHCSNTVCNATYMCADPKKKPINYVQYVTNNRNTIKEQLIDKGPLAASMGIGSRFGGHWDGDIYRCNFDNGTSHAIIISGYNDTGNYWIIKNSYGVGFNNEPDPQDGYFFLGYGECRIENHVYWAINDTQPPTPAKNLDSLTHDIAVCTNDNNVRVSWDPATDTGSGLAGYSIKWSQSDPDMPNKTIDIWSGEVSQRRTLGDGCWYFHIRSVDYVGHWSPYDISTGYYCIDRTEPYTVTNLQSSSHTENVLSNDNTVDVSWTGAWDNNTLSPTCYAGVTNYSIKWSQSWPLKPDQTADISSDVLTNTSPPLDDGEWYFTVRSLDGAGNWDDDFASIGPFLIDTEKPYHIFSEAENKWFTETTPTLNINFFDDIALDDTFFDYDTWDGSGWIIDSDNTGTYYMDDWQPDSWGSVGDGIHYLYFRISDDAGNVYLTPNDTAGFTINKDTTPPDIVVSGAPVGWDNAAATASINCTDDGSGCYSATFRFIFYDSDPGSCPETYSNYSRAEPNTVYSYKWLCGAGKDMKYNEGFSTPVEFKIDRINPIAYAGLDQTALINEIVTFNGSATDSGGSDVNTSSYSWDFGDGGAGSGQTPVHIYANHGTYTVTLTVKDNAGNSDTDTLTVHVKTKPNAIIDSILPKPIIEGADVYFTGHGTDADSNNNIVAYNWMSDLDGFLSSSASFNTNLLSAGLHTIYFKVQDNDTLWSDEVWDTIRVYPPRDWPMFHRKLDNTGATYSQIANAGNQIYGTTWTGLTGNFVYSSPAIADLDGDKTNGLEIVVGSKDGLVYAFDSSGMQLWTAPAIAAGAFDSSPAIADIDLDGNLDVVIGNDDGKVYAFDNTGNALPGWPYASPMLQPFDSSPAIADIDEDGSLDIVIGNDDGNVYVIDNSGTWLWSFATGGAVDSSPALVDIDTTSPGLETIVGSDDGNLYVIDSTGVQLASTPFGAAVDSSPAVADICSEVKYPMNCLPGPEIVVGADDNRVHCINYNPGVLTEYANYLTGGQVDSSPAIGFLYEFPEGEIAVGSNDGNVYLLGPWCNKISNFSTGFPVVSSPAITEIDTAFPRAEVVVGSDDMNIYGISFAWWPPVPLWVAPTGSLVRSSPAVGEIDHDGTLEIAVGSYDFNLYVLDTGNPVQDSDNDTVVDVNDNCPYVNNTPQIDADGDGVGDVCDNCWNMSNPDQNDTDGDCLFFIMPYLQDPKCGDSCDNCPLVSNPDQNDTDSGSNTVGLWHMNEGSGSTTDDSSAYENDGTINGASWTTGKFDQGLYFHGGGQFDAGSDSVVIPQSSSLDITSEFTVEAWIKATGTSNYLAIVDKYDPSGGISKGFSFLLSSGNLRLTVYSGAVGYKDIIGTQDLRDDTWHHVAGGWNGSHAVLYLDGNLHRESAWSYGPVSASINVGIGKRLSGQGGYLPFLGVIDEVRISNTTRSPSDILEHYNSGIEYVGEGDGVGDACDNCPEDYNPSQTDTDNDGYGQVCECNDSDDTVYPGAPELCDNLDNNCDGTTDAFAGSCGSGGCIGTNTCTAGIWGDCSSLDQDCGICCSCDSSGDETYNATQDTDCGLCQECGDVLNCTYQLSGNDLKDECDIDECKYGYCDGSGDCSMISQGTDCAGVGEYCMACDGLGNCNSMPTDDSDCGTIDCDGLDEICRDYDDMTSNRCQAFGSCIEANGIGCTDYTDASSSTDCGVCALCDGLGSCNVYDETQDVDCPDFICTDGCSIDSNPFTWDYADDVTNVCTGIFICTDDTCDYSHMCYDDDIYDTVNSTTCGATCDEDWDCDDLNPDTVDICLENCTCENREIIEEIIVTIHSPNTSNYPVEVVWLKVTANIPVDTWEYVLNGGGRQEFTPNITLNNTHGIVNCTNTLTVYATASGQESSASVQFNALTGDIDGNLKVDIFDVVLCSGAYMETSGQPGFLPQCDISPVPDGNGIINIFDIVAIAGSYGKICHLPTCTDPTCGDTDSACELIPGFTKTRSNPSEDEWFYFECGDGGADIYLTKLGSTDYEMYGKLSNPTSCPTTSDDHDPSHLHSELVIGGTTNWVLVHRTSAGTDGFDIMLHCDQS